MTADNRLETAYNRAKNGEDVTGTIEFQTLQIDYETLSPTNTRFFKVCISRQDGSTLDSTGPAAAEATAYVLESIPDIDTPLPDSGELRASIEL